MDEIWGKTVRKVGRKDKGKCVDEVELDIRKEQWGKEGFGNEEAMNEVTYFCSKL